LKKTTIVCGDLNVAHTNMDLSRASTFSEKFAGFTP
jgi:exonuclease III